MNSNNKIYSAVAYFLLLVVMFCLGTVEGEAQRLQISFRVKVLNKADNDKQITTPVLCKLYTKSEDAVRAKAEFDRISKSESSKLHENVANFKKKHGIVRESGNGVFSGINAIPGMGVFVLLGEDCVAETFEIKEGVTNYPDVILKVHRSKGGTGKGKNRHKGPGPAIDADDGKLRIPIRVSVDSDLIKRSSRLILQPYVVDCENDDTVKYPAPMVYDASEYHGLQDRRMDFDFKKNDKLASFYKEGGIPTYIEDTIVYKKKDKKRHYRGPIKYTLEDYHHVYHDEIIAGTCLIRRPFKFLDFSVAIPEMNLTEEYYDMAEEQVDDVQSDLKLIFIEGKADLSQDSINEAERIRLTETLKSYGKDLLSPAIVGTASPDGGDKINRDLAEKRARKTRDFISSYLPSRTSLSVKTYVYTWEDVAVELDKLHRREEAQAVRNVIAAHGKRTETELDGAMKDLPFYKTIIKPLVLEGMRSVKCTYSYVKQHVLTQDEVVRVYHRDKKDFLSERKPPLSSGDFYNLYNALSNDTVEQDTVTMIAYNWLKKQPEASMYNKKIAPYVYCRMARLLQRHGKPDSLLLSPFLDDSVGINVFVNKEGLSVKMNRAEVFATQILNYYQMQEFGKAAAYLKFLTDEGKVPPGMEKLDMFMTIKDSLFTNEGPKFQRAKDEILKSLNNRAILYTELPEWRPNFNDDKEKQFVYVDDLITQMDDNNPIKWYLKGLLWSEKSDSEPDLSAYMNDEQTDDFKRLSPEEEDSLFRANNVEYNAYMNKLQNLDNKRANDSISISSDKEEQVKTNDIKHYLAYFHHCFQLEPLYKRHYYAEGLVDENKRKRYKYLKKDFAGYEEVFKWLKRSDDAHAKELKLKDDNEAGGLNDVEGNTVGQTGSADTTSPAETVETGTETGATAPKKEN